VIAGDDLGDVVEPLDVGVGSHQIANRLAARAPDALGEGAAVGVRVDGDHPVLTGIGERHAQQRRDRGLFRHRPSREHGDELRAAVQRCRNAPVESLARTRACCRRG
jgi:hypothetical protein